MLHVDLGICFCWSEHVGRGNKAAKRLKFEEELVDLKICFNNPGSERSKVENKLEIWSCKY